MSFLDSGFNLQNSGFCIPDSGSTEIPGRKISSILHFLKRLDSGFCHLDLKANKKLDSGFQITFRGVITFLGTFVLYIAGGEPI